jgi:hypothetical protein
LVMGTNAGGFAVTLSDLDGSIADRRDEAMEYRLRCVVLADQHVRALLWRLAVERPTFRLLRPWPHPLLASAWLKHARAVAREHHRYRQQLSGLAKRSDGHFTVRQLDGIIERLRERCVLDLDTLDYRPPADLTDSDLALLFEMLPTSDGWACGKPDPRRVRGEELRTVEYVAASIAARMTGRARTWMEADRMAATEGDWHSTPEAGCRVVRKHRQRLRRRLPLPAITS